MTRPIPRSRSLTRDELYAEVWKEPATAVAARYGITSTALAKICLKLRVPTPPRGYWQRIAVGHRIKRPALPAPRAGHAVVHVITPILRAGASMAADFDIVPPVIAVPDVISTWHPLVERYEPRLRRHRKSVWTQTDCLAVHVSPEHLDRALRIMHALASALDAIGAVLVVGRPTTTTAGTTASMTTITLGDVRFAFSLTEELRCEEPEGLREAIARARTLRNTRSFGEWLEASREVDELRKRVRYVPNGQLAIHFDVGEYLPESVQTCVRDTKRWRLEDRLGAIVVQLQVIARLVQEKRARDAEEAVRAAEAKRLRELQDRAELREKRLREDLERRYDAFTRVDAILTLADAVEARADVTPSARAWAEWARGRAAVVRKHALDVEPAWDMT